MGGEGGAEHNSMSGTRLAAPPAARNAKADTSWSRGVTIPSVIFFVESLAFFWVRFLRSSFTLARKVPREISALGDFLVPGQKEVTHGMSNEWVTSWAACGRANPFNLFIPLSCSDLLSVSFRTEFCRTVRIYFFYNLCSCLLFSCVSLPL